MPYVSPPEHFRSKKQGTSYPALASRNFRLLWRGQAFSLTGTAMQNAAVLWHVSLLAEPGEKALALGMVEGRPGGLHPRKPRVEALQTDASLPTRDWNSAIEFPSGSNLSFAGVIADESAKRADVASGVGVTPCDGHSLPLLSRGLFRDASAASRPPFTLFAESRTSVEALAPKATARGAQSQNMPSDHGFIYQHEFEDPDGHMWERFHIDPSG